MREPRIKPNRDLGQNFLVDPNILGVIDRAASLDSEDVVLEVGGGLGVLSELLAERGRFVHVVEVDRRLEEALGAVAARHGNVALHWGDALRVDLGDLEPRPTAMVANLPYGIAATLLLRTIAELTSIRRWTVMVQREVGERFAARPGTASYGSPSVLAQLECDVKVVRSIPRTVFHPQPNVDSVLLSLTRTDQSPSAAVRQLVSSGFAHRRKTLAGSLKLVGSPAVDHERLAAALADLGLPADVRAERLSPQQFRSLAVEIDL
ncbi:MAG TPA: 16S rRNA (adenine(1518)-N(6)/adenine(1519)-N(6))-dimethyltransferase RsmA [Solirubrobacteraceae bacterium]|nr:16S rRNA (adenine(1518)-N(6)/adenine(1519)-N(6))-dimethyltransferase RsmA [Solirubrobacteraceae bacterium]